MAGLTELVAAPLAGLVVYLSPGHGWVCGSWGCGWQRDDVAGVREDEWTWAFASEDLAPALEAAGATVLSARELDPHPVAVIAGPGEARWEGDAATWALAAPEDGAWRLYLSWLTNEDPDPAAIVEWWTAERGGRAVVDQRAHGGEWWPLARLDVRGGEEVRIVVRGSGRGQVSADRVRLGGGSPPVAGGVDPPRRAADLAAAMWLPFAGAPAEVWRPGGTGPAGDAHDRARWAAWSHPDGEEAIYLSVHTDAGSGRGTVAFVRQRCAGEPCPARVAASVALGDALREGLVGAVRRAYSPTWGDRGTIVNDLAEINDTINGEMPAVLLEVGFHDSRREVLALRDPRFRELAAAGLLDGLIRWRAAWGVTSGSAEPP